MSQFVGSIIGFQPESEALSALLGQSASLEDEKGGDSSCPASDRLPSDQEEMCELVATEGW